MLDRKSEKVIPVYSILPSGEFECGQVPVFNPAQDGNFADTTMPGNNAGGEIFRVGFFNVYSQIIPPSNRVYYNNGVSVSYPNSNNKDVYVIHTVNHVNDTTGNTITPLCYI